MGNPRNQTGNVRQVFLGQTLLFFKGKACFGGHFISFPKPDLWMCSLDLRSKTGKLIVWTLELAKCFESPAKN